MDMFIDAFLDALIDSAKMIPLLFVIYVLIELLELKLGNRLGRFMARVGKAGPILGALAGIIPQCGISVVGSALYTQRLITVGTLFAVFIATSDEAIPVILSQPDKALVLVPLLAIKLVLAIVVGYLLDLVFRARAQQALGHAGCYVEGHDDEEHDHETAFEEKGCCGHTPTSEGRKVGVRELLVHPLVHTLKVFVFIFLISLVIALLFAFVGQERIALALGAVPFLQPFFAALVGLIPNCAASVAIAELYLSGVITFGACIAGLSSSAGIGLLVLFKEGSRKEAWVITAALFAISVLAGFLIQTIGAF